LYGAAGVVLQARQQQMAFSFAQLDKAPYGNVLFAGEGSSSGAD
jgi:hypothetical protein